MLLRSLSFDNTADELSSFTRTVDVTIFQPMENSTCQISIDVSLINDNVPVVDLNGPEQLFQNYSTTVAYSYLSPNSVNIASSDAQIIDLDMESTVVSLMVELIAGQDGDRLLFNTNLCPLFVSTDSNTCYLRSAVMVMYLDLCLSTIYAYSICKLHVHTDFCDLLQPLIFTSQLGDQFPYLCVWQHSSSIFYCLTGSLTLFHQHQPNRECVK